MTPTIQIYDNGGETCDRYTVIINNDVYGMSADAMSPQGFNQFCGDVKTDFNLQALISHPVNLPDLPEQVQRAIALRIDSYLPEVI